jgi:hypothetical protein
VVKSTIETPEEKLADGTGDEKEQPNGQEKATEEKNETEKGQEKTKDAGQKRKETPLAEDVGAEAIDEVETALMESFDEVHQNWNEAASAGFHCGMIINVSEVDKEAHLKAVFQMYLLYRSHFLGAGTTCEEALLKIVDHITGMCYVEVIGMAIRGYAGLLDQTKVKLPEMETLFGDYSELVEEDLPLETEMKDFEFKGFHDWFLLKGKHGIRTEVKARMEEIFSDEYKHLPGTTARMFFNRCVDLDLDQILHTLNNPTDVMSDEVNMPATGERSPIRKRQQFGGGET